MTSAPARHSLGLALLAAALAAAACDRAVEPFDPAEKAEAPDLSRIFPKGAERAPADGPAAAPMRGAPPPGAPAPAGALPSGPLGGSAAAPGGDPIRGRIELAPALAGRVPPGAVLFLVARTGESGPPVAVKRFADPRFPLEFEIGAGDLMLEGVPFAGPFELSVRVDADRNAATRTPGDLQGTSASRVPTGASGVELVIDTVL